MGLIHWTANALARLQCARVYVYVVCMLFRSRGTTFGCTEQMIKGMFMCTCLCASAHVYVFQILRARRGNKEDGATKVFGRAATKEASKLFRKKAVLVLLEMTKPLEKRFQ